MQPDFLVIGAQKAGSTYLVEALRAHEQVYMPAREVPSFEDPNYAADGVKRLFELLEPGRGHQCVGAKRASWLALPECPPRIARHCPHAKLLAILRNPVERAVSSLFNLMHAAKLPLLPADEALRRILDNQLQASSPAASIVLEFGRYHEHLRRYLEHFDRQQMLILLYDDLQADAASVVRSMYTFLGVNQPATLAPSARRPMASPYSMARLRILRALQPTYTKLEPGGLRRSPRRGPFPFVMKHLAGGLDRVVLAPLLHAPRPALEPQSRQRLVDYYREDVTALGQLLNRDLSHWLDD